LYDYLVLSRDETEQKTSFTIFSTDLLSKHNEIEENLQDDVIKGIASNYLSHSLIGFYEKKKLVLRPKSDIPSK